MNSIQRTIRKELHAYFLRLDRENRLIQIGIMPHSCRKNFDKNGKYRPNDIAGEQLVERTPYIWLPPQDWRQ